MLSTTIRKSTRLVTAPITKSQNVPPLQFPRSFTTFIRPPRPRKLRSNRLQFLSTRHSSTAFGSFLSSGSTLARAHPAAVSGAAAMITACLVVLYMVTNYHQTALLEGVANFPEPVEKLLRRALHHEHIDPSIKSALDYYKRAIAKAEELGMDPFGDPVLGIKLSVAQLFNRNHLPEKEAEVLELVRADCLRWLEVKAADDPEGRKRIRRRAIEISHHLALLYGSTLTDKLKSNDFIKWAALELFAELEQQSQEGQVSPESVTQKYLIPPASGLPDPDLWMNQPEIGAILELYGHALMSRGNAELAMMFWKLCKPLFPDYWKQQDILNHINLGGFNLAFPMDPDDPEGAARKVFLEKIRDKVQKIVWEHTTRDVIMQTTVENDQSSPDLAWRVAAESLLILARIDEQLGNITDAIKSSKSAMEKLKANGQLEEWESLVNQNLRVHNLATYSAQAVRHVAEALDALYWAESEPDRNEDLGEALERGRDFRIDSHAEALPSEWPEEVYEEEVADAERYQELQAQLLDLLERKQEAQRMLGTYRKLGGLLDPFNDPRNTIQPNLVTRNGELAKELERMRILVARVGGRIGTLSSLTGKRADIQTSESVQGADKLNALFDSWQ
ncbi:MAG: hypothetical protein M1814_002666 [Vezdaea aestivalis]|nr:MAG: hypothetical protein M1814_002666 [Vezdaea aestivalis]